MIQKVWSVPTFYGRSRTGVNQGKKANIILLIQKEWNIVEVPLCGYIARRKEIDKLKGSTSKCHLQKKGSS